MTDFKKILDKAKELEAKWTFFLIFLYTNLKQSDDNGDPVEQIVLSFSNLYTFLKFLFVFLKASIYFALTPNKVIFSWLAIFMRRSSRLYIGKPSNNTIDAFEAKTEISQFHIIHPHVVK